MENVWVKLITFRILAAFSQKLRRVQMTLKIAYKLHTVHMGAKYFTSISTAPDSIQSKILPRFHNGPYVPGIGFYIEKINK